MSTTEPDNKATILDYLNEDCWMAVFSYIPVKYVIKSERVSDRWQELVLKYLRRLRIAIRYPLNWLSFCDDDYGIDGTYGNYYLGDNEVVVVLNKRAADYLSFARWTSKLGASVVSTYCATIHNMETIGENCPNLETLEIFPESEENIPTIHHENFKWLRRLYFQKYNCVSDVYISSFIANNSVLEELEINNNEIVTGKCLLNIKSEALKSLMFKQCRKLKMCNLLDTASRHNLTKLELIDVPYNIYENIHLILNKLPNLEHLRVLDEVMDCDHFFEAVCRLSKLKFLVVMYEATDTNLEDMTRCCKDLTILELGDCSTVSSRGMEAVIRNVGARITRLGIPKSKYLEDDDVIACVRGCPNLMFLDLSGCLRLREGMLIGADEARRRMRAQRSLKVVVEDTFLHFDEDTVFYRVILCYQAVTS
ncbi:uncharacterized protein LOC134668201 [Cydia fagiglandana]|uniref:uncharacterized protein LOC134668201 n=1 Tax=Cydia fagiglandana TaxID=1458189 RepID=UPI002FEE343C